MAVVVVEALVDGDVEGLKVLEGHWSFGPAVVAFVLLK